MGYTMATAEIITYYKTAHNNHHDQPNGKNANIE
jgi:hypothetical protein